jgi:hypothetical protein
VFRDKSRLIYHIYLNYQYILVNCFCIQNIRLFETAAFYTKYASITACAYVIRRPEKVDVYRVDLYKRQIADNLPLSQYCPNCDMMSISGPSTLANILWSTAVYHNRGIMVVVCYELEKTSSATHP